MQCAKRVTILLGYPMIDLKVFGDGEAFTYGAKGDSFPWQALQDLLRLSAVTDGDLFLRIKTIMPRPDLSTHTDISVKDLELATQELTIWKEGVEKRAPVSNKRLAKYDATVPDYLRGLHQVLTATEVGHFKAVVQTSGIETIAEACTEESEEESQQPMRNALKVGRTAIECATGCEADMGLW